MKPPFALVDCNNFYVSCERVFNPALERTPMIVLSNNDGCIISRSNEAKALNIPMGAPVFQCRETMREFNIRVFSSNYALYGDMSRRVMEILSGMTPDLEIYSIDEAFLSFEGFVSSNLTEYARHIRRTVKQWTGLPVSIGLGPTKTLAKAANQLAKTNPELGGVLNFNEAVGLDSWLGRLEVGKVWGVGRQYEKFLRRNGIDTALELKNLPDSWIRKHMKVMGLRTIWELRGVSCLPLDQDGAPRKGILTSRSFGRSVTALEELREAVATYISRAAEKLRSERSAASQLHVFLMTNHDRQTPNAYHSSMRELPVPTSYTAELIHVAQEILEKIFKRGARYKKAGVMFTGLVSQEALQQDLFISSSPPERYLPLMGVVDRINHRWGSDAIQYAAAGLKKEWKNRRNHRSPSYTTRWEAIPVVKAEGGLL